MAPSYTHTHLALHVLVVFDFQKKNRFRTKVCTQISTGINFTHVCSVRVPLLTWYDNSSPPIVWNPPFEICSSFSFNRLNKTTIP